MKTTLCSVQILGHRSRCVHASVSARRRRGVMLVLFIVCLPVILAFSMYVINISWMQLTRTELRTATDAAARAGSRTLSLTQDEGQARAAAVTAARGNTVAGDPLLLAPSDLELGVSRQSHGGLWRFSPLASGRPEINAVRVTGRRVQGSPSGPVPLLFNGLFDRTVFEPVKTATATQIDRDIVLVLDQSGSMEEPTPTGQKWSDLVAAVQVFLATLELTPQDEKVGLVTYETSAWHRVDLTFDYQRIPEALVNIPPWGRTAIGDGVELGATTVLNPAYTRKHVGRTVVLMTDGMWNEGIDPIVTAKRAKEMHNVTVHTITFGIDTDKAHMQRVAAVGRGGHWHADDQASLIRVFEEVANIQPTLLTE